MSQRVGEWFRVSALFAKALHPTIPSDIGGRRSCQDSSTLTAVARTKTVGSSSSMCTHALRGNPVTKVTSD